MAILTSLAVLLSAVSTAVLSAPVIDAPWGRISGKDLAVSGDGAPFYAYLGIPYALPPVGDRRFAKPEPHPGVRSGNSDTDASVFDATTHGNICPQLSLKALPAQSEDCLTLSVYTPTTSSDEPRAVMIWIHGGSYQRLFGPLFVPGRMVTEGDVIVVVIQYRLGILGFLSSGDAASPGNYGLWDQNLAMKWVKDNIQAFGGDPGSITIFGESAGAASVGMHVLSPHARGLFKRAVLQSGTPFPSYTIRRQPQTDFYTLATVTGCMPEGTTGLRYTRSSSVNEAILACLRNVDADRLIQFTYFPFEDFPTKEYPDTPFIPVVDGDYVERDPAHLVLDPAFLEANGVTEYDVMIGVTNNEGKYITGVKGIFEIPDEALPVFRTDAFLNFLMKSYLEFTNDGNFPAQQECVVTALAQAVKSFYTESQENGQIELQALADLITDLFFVVPAVTMTKALVGANALYAAKYPDADVGRVYMYLFDHYPEFAEQDKLPGTNHGTDLYYEFDPFPPVIVRDGFTDEDRKLAEMFVAVLTDFAKTGTLPGKESKGELKSFKALPPDGQSYLALAPTPRVETNLYAGRVAFWLTQVPALLSATNC